MEQFWQFNIGQVGQVVVALVVIGIMFQKLRDDIKNQGTRLAIVETKMDQIQAIVVSSARQDERISAMDQRMLAQGTRLDSTAAILAGRMDAINNIVSGHTAQLNNMPRTKS